MLVDKPYKRINLKRLRGLIFNLLALLDKNIAIGYLSTLMRLNL